MFVFPSDEWARAYKEAINQSPTYKTAGKDWTFGPVALVTKADPAIGIREDVGLWLDLHQGVCRDARLCARAEAEQAPFCITGEYARWKQVMRKQLDPIQGMMQKKLELKGQMTIIVRFVAASKALVEATQSVPTKFLDE
ncbi:MAG TPA: SCP2 sterol-binding domain-containing protein [Polyangia bacterium]|nr:SCP2 sterol-binding domain-containing protein [Polyangia bacterium]